MIARLRASYEVTRLELDPPKTYPSPGRCIYCGAKGVALGDEHIIPLALGGAFVIAKASCRSCEKITHRYERTVARQIFGNFRLRHNFPTRHPEERPKHLRIGTVTAGGVSALKDIPVVEHHGTAFTYKFGRAHLLAGLPRGADKLQFIPIAIVDHDDAKRLIERHHWDGKVTIRVTPYELARMVAKIAHAYAVAELGIDSFNPLALDVVLNQTEDVGYTVGGTLDDVPPVEGGAHLLEISYDGIVPNVFIIVGVRLFSSLGAPVYHVVVGNFDFQKPQHVKTFHEQQRRAATNTKSFPHPFF